MKKFLAGCLCFVMILCMVPTVQAKAQNSEHSHAICGNLNCTEDHNNDGEAESHANVVWQAWDGSDKDLATEGIQLTAGNWYLEGNITPSDTINIVGEVNLCLNGMVINGANHEEKVIVVQEGATLTLCDCQDTEHKFTPNGEGKWVLDEVSGTRVVSGGVITASTSWSDGAIDCVGNLNMYGGNIVGNHAWMYGAITVNNGLLNMYGGTICGNTGCSAIYVWHWGAQSNIHGGKIYENRIEEGAVYVTGSSSLGISGNLEIYDNTTGTEKKNLVKDWSCTIKLVGELYNTKPIGINCSERDIGVFIKADGNNVNDLTEYLDHFVSDDPMKVLYLTTDNKGIELDYYGVAVQPSIDNNYTVTVNYPEGANYQWYTGIIIPVTTENGSEFSDNNSASSYNQNTGEWSYETTLRDTRTATYISDVALRAGDVLKITVSASDDIHGINRVSVESREDEIEKIQSENGVYTFKIRKDGTYAINMDLMNAMGSKPSIKAEIITVEDLINGQTAERMNTATLDDGKYICKVTWDKGTIDTSDDSVALSDIVEFEKTGTPLPEITVPVITGHPANASAKVGETTTFTVTATGDALSYQWMIDRNDNNGFVNITNAINASYTTSTVNVNCNGFKYKCVVTNAAGSTTSNIATLSVEVTDSPSNDPSGEDGAPTPAPTYTILEGANSDHAIGAAETVTVRADGDFVKFTGVKVNGVLIDAKYYTAVSGSTIVTLKQEYLDSLAEGTYKMTIVFNDGECSTNFQIKKSVVTPTPEQTPAQEQAPTPEVTPSPEVTSPKTGDDNMMFVWIFAMMFAVLVIRKVVKVK